jgi:hypothetical protein
MLMSLVLAKHVFLVLCYFNKQWLESWLIIIMVLNIGCGHDPWYCVKFWLFLIIVVKFGRCSLNCDCTAVCARLKPLCCGLDRGCEHLLKLRSRFVILSWIAVKWSGWLASIAVVVAPQSRHNFICCWELWSNVADAASIAFAWRWRRHKKLDVAIEIIVAFLHFLTYFISFPI